MYPVPCEAGPQVAKPFWSTAAKGTMFPTQEFGDAFGALVNSPLHHVTSLLVSVTGDGGALNSPDAVNWNWPFCAVATEGCTVTLCRCRALPQLKAAREKSKRGPTEREQNPVTMHLRANNDAGGMNRIERELPALVSILTTIRALFQTRHPNGKAS